MHGWKQKQIRQVVYIFLVSIYLVLAVGVWLHPAQLHINQATVTEILDGNQVFIQGRRVQIDSIARSGEQIITGASRVGLRFNNGAAGRLRPNTSLVIGQCVQIQKGGIIASGPINGCASSVRATTRGTTFIMGWEAGKYGCKVLEGSIAMTPIDKTNPSQYQELIVEQGKKVSITKKGEISQPEAITKEEILAILNGSFFSGFTQQLPGSRDLQRVLQELFPGIPLPTT